MCGRFALGMPRRQAAEALGVAELPAGTARYNIAPGQWVAVVLEDAVSGTRQAELAWWGLIPPWVREASPQSRIINARAETVCDKPAFRAAVRRGRCLVPAQGFYEWRIGSRGKTPYFLEPGDGGVLAMAGIRAPWTGRDGTVLSTLAILTRESAGAARLVHDRMPVCLAAANHAAWLATATDPAEAVAMALGAPGPEFIAFPVSRAVNDVRHDGPDCPRPIGPALLVP